TCSGGNEYACFYENPTRYYADIPYDRSGNEVAGGMNAATTRILVGYDRVFGGNFEVGARVGYAFGGGPKAPEGNGFFPFHAEARVAYVFGSDPFSRKGIRPYVNVSGGLAQVDAKLVVPVYRSAQDYTADKRTE